MTEFYRSSSGVERFTVTALAERLHSLLSKYVVHIKPSKILDVGCGEQPLREWLERQGLEYIGLDARQNQNGSVEFISAIDIALAEGILETGPFGLIICTEVLEHVLDWFQAFQNLSELMAPGGLLILSAPFLYQLHEEPIDYWRPTPHAIKQFAKYSGLTVIHEERVGDDLDAIGMILEGFYTLPTAFTLRDRMSSYLFKIWASLGRLFYEGSLHDSLDVHGRLFLTNIFVLKKHMK